MHIGIFLFLQRRTAPSFHLVVVLRRQKRQYAIVVVGCAALQNPSIELSLLLLRKKAAFYGSQGFFNRDRLHLYRVKHARRGPCTITTGCCMLLRVWEKTRLRAAHWAKFI